jgi:hypothetical protein
MYPLRLIIKPPAFVWLKPVQLQVEQTIAYQSANLAAFCVNSPVFAVIDSFQTISYAFGLVEFVLSLIYSHCLLMMAVVIPYWLVNSPQLTDLQRKELTSNSLCVRVCVDFCYVKSQ